MSMRSKLAIVVFFLAGFCIGGTLLAADVPIWPRFHGPDGTGISSDTGLLKKWPEQGPEGPTWAHPVVCGGRLYIRHGDNLYAYDVRGK